MRPRGLFGLPSATGAARACCAAALLWIASSLAGDDSPVHAPGNLLSNPSMEFGIARFGEVADWVPSSAEGRAEYAWSTEAGRTGESGGCPPPALECLQALMAASTAATERGITLTRLPYGTGGLALAGELSAAPGPGVPAVGLWPPAVSYLPEGGLMVVDRGWRVLIWLTREGAVTARRAWPGVRPPPPTRLDRAFRLMEEVRVILTDGWPLPPPESDPGGLVPPPDPTAGRALLTGVPLADGQVAMLWGPPRPAVRLYRLDGDTELEEIGSARASLDGGTDVREARGWEKLRMAIGERHPEWRREPPVIGVSRTGDDLVVALGRPTAAPRCVWLSRELQVVRESLGAYPVDGGRAYGLVAGQGAHLTLFDGESVVSEAPIPGEALEGAPGAELQVVGVLGRVGTDALLELAEPAERIEYDEAPPAIPTVLGRVARVSAGGELVDAIDFRRVASPELLPCCGYDGQRRVAIPHCDDTAVGIVEVAFNDR